MLPSRATNDFLIFLPFSVLIGIFCRFGSVEDSLPVCAPAIWKVVWILSVSLLIFNIRLSVYVFFNLFISLHFKISLAISIPSSDNCSSTSEFVENPPDLFFSYKEVSYFQTEYLLVA